MLSFADLEQLAAAGGYETAGRDISRITVTDVHRLFAGLARSADPDVAQATVALSRLRRWIIHGDGTPPPVRGCGYLHSNRTVWMAYTTIETPAVVRGRASALAELRSYLGMAISPDYDGSLRAKTNPAVSVEVSEGKIVLSSSMGRAVMSVRAATYVEHWISVSMRPNDKRGVLCLPAQWQPT